MRLALADRIQASRFLPQTPRPRETSAARRPLLAYNVHIGAARCARRAPPTFSIGSR